MPLNDQDTKHHKELMDITLILVKYSAFVLWVAKNHFSE